MRRWPQLLLPLLVANAFLRPAPRTTPSRRPAATLEPPVQQQTLNTKEKVAILLLNLGGPQTTADVEPFLYNLFADPDIIRLPSAIGGLQTALAWLIATRRAPKSRAAYESIGGGSPITMYTMEQGRLLEEALNGDGSGVEYKSYVAMRYWHPFTDEALDKAVADGCTSAVVLPLYPHFSISTTGSSLRALLSEMQASHPQLMASHTVVPSWHDSRGYVNLVARLVAEELDGLMRDVGPLNPGEPPPTVLFSAHGVPVSYIEEAGDPYKGHIEKTVRLVSEQARKLHPHPASYELCFQSRVGPVKWLEPYTDAALEAIGAEIDIEYREVAEDAGIKHWRRAPALNLDGEFIDELAHQVTSAVNKPVVSSVEACVVNAFDLRDEPLGVLPGVEAAPVELINTKTATVAIAIAFIFGSPTTACTLGVGAV
ncbi:ferrochelatase [Aureococcus anophagefferens]|nr:ferrochelatase [Aureococcus anophagefferens]